MKFSIHAALVGLFSCTLASAGVNDSVTTGAEQVGQIHISGNVYYFQSTDFNWSAPNCPNARYAYISEDQPGAKAMLSVALSAKATKAKIQFSGLCGDTGGSDLYIRITKIIFP